MFASSISFKAKAAATLAVLLCSVPGVVSDSVAETGEITENRNFLAKPTMPWQLKDQIWTAEALKKRIDFLEQTLGYLEFCNYDESMVGDSKYDRVIKSAELPSSAPIIRRVKGLVDQLKEREAKLQSFSSVGQFKIQTGNLDYCAI